MLINYHGWIALIYAIDLKAEAVKVMMRGFQGRIANLTGPQAILVS